MPSSEPIESGDRQFDGPRPPSRGGGWPPPGPPKLEVVGYELEVRPYAGLWSRFEGRIIKLVRSSAASAAKEPYRDHYLPDHGPASDGRTFVTTQPYWARSRSRERLERRLKAKLNRRVEEQRRQRAERIPLTDTMAGWD